MQKSANNINDSMDSKKNNYMRNSNEFKMKKMDIPLEKMLLKKKLEEGICRKSIVCLEPIDCKGLQYAKKSEKEDGKTHEIVIDERGYIKKYIEKGQRVEISP